MRVAEGLILQRDKNINLSAQKRTRNPLADLRFEREQRPGHTCLNITKTVIDGLDLDYVSFGIKNALGPSISGHAFSHKSGAPL